MGSGLLTLLCFLLAAAYAWNETGTLSGTLAHLWVVLVLAVLEISLSFDNAVVNASILTEMDAAWRKRQFERTSRRVSRQPRTRAWARRTAPARHQHRGRD